MNEEPVQATPAAPRSRKRFFIFAAALVVVVLAGVLYILLLPKEPSYHGKLLTYWLQQYQQTEFGDPKDPKRIESTEALRQIGTNAIPTLLRKLQARDSAAKSKLMEWNDEHDFLHLHLVPAEVQNSLAVGGFAVLGGLATNAIPAVLDIYNHAPNQESSSKECANSILMGMYPAPGAANPSWIPAKERVDWFIAAGQQRLRFEDYTNAALAFSEAIRQDPTNALTYVSHATALIQLSDWTNALADVRKALDLDPKEQGALYIEGFCKFSLKDFKGAEADLTTVINRNTNHAHAYNFRGLTRANLRDLDGAMADLNQAIKLSPDEASAYRNRSMVENLQREYESALADVSRSIDLDNKDPYTIAARGRIRNSLKDYEGARADFDKAIEMKARDPGIYISRASASVHLDDFEKADADLEVAQQLAPDSAFFRVVRGFLKAKRGDDDGSLADFERAVELSPQMAETYAMLGFLQYKASQWTPALENCRKALQLHVLGDRSDLLAYIWLIQAQTGQEKEGNGELGAYLKSLESAKTNDWEASVARFLIGNIAESNLLTQATTTAKRPSSVKAQMCESLYYAGMKRKLAGDKPGAMEFFRKCLDTKNDNNLGYMNAGVEMRALKKAD